MPPPSTRLAAEPGVRGGSMDGGCCSRPKGLRNVTYRFKCVSYHQSSPPTKEIHDATHQLVSRTVQPPALWSLIVFLPGTHPTQHDSRLTCFTSYSGTAGAPCSQHPFAYSPGEPIRYADAAPSSSSYQSFTCRTALPLHIRVAHLPSIPRAGDASTWGDLHRSS